MATETITLKLVAQDLMSGNVSKAVTGLDKLAQKGGLVGSVLQGVGQSFGQMINPAALVAKGIGVVTDVMGDSMRAASDQAEALSKVTVVFGDQADEIKAWANAAAGSMGMTKTAALEAAGTLGNLFDGLGLAEDAGASMSKAIVQLAADLGSFNNVASEDALLALRSGLLGEAEPMRKFGSALNAARVEAYGFANGLYETVRVGGKLKQVMSEAHKVQARYALILQDTKNAQGDFARTADGMANSQKTINAAFEDMKVQIGDALNQAALPFLAFMVDVVGQAPNTANAVGRMTAKMREMVEAQKEQIDTSKEQIGLFDWVGREIYGLISPQDKLISEYTNANKEMVATLGVTRKEFALFVEAGLTAGLTLEQITTTVRKLQGEVGATAVVVTGAGSKIAETARTIDDFVSSWDRFTSLDDPGIAALVERDLDLVTQHFHELPADIQGALREMGVVVKEGVSRVGTMVISLPEKFTIAVVDMKARIKEGKAGIIEQFRDLAWQSKHPFAEKNYSRWLEEKHEQAIRLMKRAVKQGRPGLIAQHRATVDAIEIEWATLPRNLARLQERINVILGRLYTNVREAVGNVFNLGGGGQKVEVRANGGPVQRGRPYVVGEHRPELFVPDQSGTILPRVPAMGGSTTNNYVTINMGMVTDPVAAGREVTKALRAFSRTDGGVGIRAAMASR